MIYDRQQFADFYSRVADDELARIALSNHLIPEAQEALTVELQKRGLTDLSEYKHALEEAAAASSPRSQLEFQARIYRAFVEWMFASMAWVLAVSLPPLIWFAAPHGSDALKLCLIEALFIAVSCYLGVKARREGSRKGFVLKFMLPLILLGMSTLAVLTSRLLGPWL